MPWIPGVATKDAGPLTRLVYRMSRKRYGAVPEPVTVTAHHPRLMLASGVHEMAVEKASRTLPANIREIAVYRTAVLLGCSWCVDFGTMLQRHEGLDIDRLTDIDNYATSPRYTEPERLVIALADAMTATPVTVTEEQIAQVERVLGRQGLIELIYHISLENMRARSNSAMDITAQGFTSGAACQVPVPSDAASG